jgi:TPR repeat protein
MESPVQVDDLVADAEEWFSLSDLYDKGIGVAKSRDESMRLLALAADDLAADAEVQFKLAHTLHFRAIEAFGGKVFREDGDKKMFL